MKTYKLNLSFAQQIVREVEAESEEEAEQMGYDIIEEVTYTKALNPDVNIIN